MLFASLECSACFGIIFAHAIIVINIYSGIPYSQWCTKNGLQGVDFTKYQVVCCPKRETIIDKESGVGMALTWDSSQTFFYVLGCIPK